MSNLVSNPFSELLLENPFWDLVFDPDKHPRWPKGSPDHLSGRFMPKSGVHSEKFQYHLAKHGVSSADVPSHLKKAIQSRSLDKQDKPNGVAKSVPEVAPKTPKAQPEPGLAPDTPGIGGHSLGQSTDEVSQAERESSRAQKAWRKKLKAPDKAAVGAYQSGPGYPVINNALRQGETPSGNIDFNFPSVGHNSVDAADAVKRLDSVMNSVPATKQPMHLWRGIEGSALKEILGGQKDPAGLEVRDNGFSSVSLDPDVAKHFTDKDGAIFHIIAPKGSKVADLGAVNPQGASDMLLSRGSTYRVTGTRVENGQRIIDATLVTG